MIYTHLLKFAIAYINHVGCDCDAEEAIDAAKDPVTGGYFDYHELMITDLWLETFIPLHPDLIPAIRSMKRTDLLHTLHGEILIAVMDVIDAHIS